MNIMLIIWSTFVFNISLVGMFWGSFYFVHYQCFTGCWIQTWGLPKQLHARQRLKGEGMFLTHQVIQLSCNGIANTGVAASDENSLACSRHLKPEVKVLTKDCCYSGSQTQKGQGPKSINLDVLLLYTLVFVFHLLININGFW